MEVIGILLLVYIVAGAIYGLTRKGEGLEGDDNLGPF